MLLTTGVSKDTGSNAMPTTRTATMPLGEKNTEGERKSEHLSSQGGGGIYINAVPLENLEEHPDQLLALADASGVGDLHSRVALPDKCGIEYGLERINGNRVRRVK